MRGHHACMHIIMSGDDPAAASKFIYCDRCRRGGARKSKPRILIDRPIPAALSELSSGGLRLDRRA
eukprot:COSAG01_NODE_63500_length_279_cov_5.205556_1_plen_65_part_01